MQILVGWDDPSQAETIELLLNVDGNSARVCTAEEGFLDAVRGAICDAVLLSLDFPCAERAYDLFQSAREAQPEAPFIGVCRQGEIMRLARFITGGLHSYLMRDEQGEFILLLTTMIESAVAAVQDQRARLLAERLREEIDSVRRLQESVIPRDLPAPEGYAIAARYEPSQIRVLGNQPVLMAGGDYYDVFRLADDKLVLLVGDAAGHGIKACMSIMTMHTLIRMFRDNSYANTADFVAEVNRRLCDNDVVQDEGGFITMLYSVLDTRAGTLEWTSAGHPMPMLQDLATGEVRSLGGEDEAGLPLAIDSDAVPYTHCRLQVPPNSRLLIYTDGLAEASPAGHSTEGEQFGESGINRTLRDSRHLPVDQALERLFTASNAFTQGTGRHDDTSAVLVERTKQPSRSG
jgi:serine phosphatase RsbU (regulator of sigma subunit)